MQSLISLIFLALLTDGVMRIHSSNIIVLIIKRWESEIFLCLCLSHRNRRTLNEHKHVPSQYKEVGQTRTQKDASPHNVLTSKNCRHRRHLQTFSPISNLYNICSSSTFQNKGKKKILCKDRGKHGLKQITDHIDLSFNVELKRRHRPYKPDVMTPEGSCHRSSKNSDEAQRGLNWDGNIITG